MYKPRCVKVFSNLGIEKRKKGKGLKEEEKQRLRKHMESDEIREWVGRQTGRMMENDSMAESVVEESGKQSGDGGGGGK
jgi:hypothetical protein